MTTVEVIKNRCKINKGDCTVCYLQGTNCQSLGKKPKDWNNTDIVKAEKLVKERKL